MIINLTKENFKKIISQTEKPVFVDFWAPWCAPCRMLTPIVEKLSNDFNDDVIFAKVNTDEETSLAQEYRIMSIPNVLVFNKGEITENIVGVRNPSFYTETLKKLTDA